MSRFRSPPVPLMQQCPSMLCSIFATGPSSSETSQISCIPAADFYLPMLESLLVPSQMKMSANAVRAVIPNSSRRNGTRDSSSLQDCAFWRLRIGRRAYLGTPHKN